MLLSVLEAPLIVLLVRVSVVARPTRVSVVVGRVRVPVLTIVLATMAPLRSRITVLAAGPVTNTSLVPALKLTKAPALLDDSTESRDRMLPAEE